MKAIAKIKSKSGYPRNEIFLNGSMNDSWHLSFGRKRREADSRLRDIFILVVVYTSSIWNDLNNLIFATTKLSMWKHQSTFVFMTSFIWSL